MANSVVQRNYLYNIFYQILAIITPIITTPYISRVLGVSGVGKYNYVYSIAYIFSLFCWLGTNIYGQREIAYVAHNKEARSKVFFEMLIIKTAAFIISSTLYVITILVINVDVNLLVLAYFYLIANYVDISWLYQGLEDFKSTVIRNSIVKIVGVILVFILVKEEKDVWKYVLILSFTTFVGQLCMWINVPKLICKYDLRALSIKGHLKSTLILFLPSVATYVYTSLDKVMLGTIINADEVGFYSQSEKIVKLAMTLVTSLGVVMLPRMTTLIKEQCWKTIDKYLDKAFRFVFFLSLPMIAGLIAVSHTFIPWFLGEGYEKSIVLLQILSPIILIIGIASITGQAVLVPLNKQTYYTLTIVSGAVVNCFLNFLLIPRFASYGASFATLIAESIVTILQLLGIKHLFDYKAAILNLCKYTMCSVLMLLVVRFIDKILLFQTSTMQLATEIVVGLSFYILVLIVLRDSFLLEIFKKIYLFIVDRSDR